MVQIEVSTLAISAAVHLADYQQAIITELIFEHALRIRMKEGRPTSSQSSSKIPDIASAAVPDVDLQDPDATHAPSSQEQTQTPIPKESSATEPDTNLIGKINNLISSDLENILMMTELFLIIVYTPLKVLLSVWFLYALLGWR